MVVGETLELFIVLGVVILSLIVLVVIDRIGIIRTTDEEEEEV